VLEPLNLEEVKSKLGLDSPTAALEYLRGAGYLWGIDHLRKVWNGTHKMSHALQVAFAGAAQFYAMKERLKRLEAENQKLGRQLENLKKMGGQRVAKVLDSLKETP